MVSGFNVFKGRHSVRDFLDPGKHPYLPLVEIPPRLNPFRAERVRIFAKLMTFSPLGNVKALPAFNMLREAYRRGELEGVRTAVENSSGNTVSSVAIAARQFGLPTNPERGVAAQQASAGGLTRSPRSRGSSPIPARRIAKTVAHLMSH